MRINSASIAIPDPLVRRLAHEAVGQCSRCSCRYSERFVYCRNIRLYFLIGAG